MPEDIAIPPDNGEPGDPRIPGLVQKMAVGAFAHIQLQKIVEQMYCRGEVADGDYIYPGIKIWVRTLLGMQLVEILEDNLSQHLPAESTPAAW